MKRPFCRPGLLWEYTITVSCHCLMPSPFMQDIQRGAPGEWPTSNKGKRLAARQAGTGAIRIGGSPGGNRGKPDWRTTLFNWRHSPFG